MSWNKIIEIEERGRLILNEIVKGKLKKEMELVFLRMSVVKYSKSSKRYLESRK